MISRSSGAGLGLLVAAAAAAFAADPVRTDSRLLHPLFDALPPPPRRLARSLARIGQPPTPNPGKRPKAKAARKARRIRRHAK